MATVKQIAFVNKLAAERRGGEVYVQTQLGGKPMEALPNHRVSDIINVLKETFQLKHGVKEFAPKPVQEKITEEGLYCNAKGDYIKVQRSKTTNNLYAKRLHYTEGEAKGAFVYEPGLIYTIKPADKVTLEEGLKFGAAVGFCCMCGRTLTDPQSVANSIGPVCATKF